MSAARAVAAILVVVLAAAGFFELASRRSTNGRGLTITSGDSHMDEAAQQLKRVRRSYANLAATLKYFGVEYDHAGVVLKESFNKTAHALHVGDRLNSMKGLGDMQRKNYLRELKLRAEKLARRIAAGEQEAAKSKKS